MSCVVGNGILNFEFTTPPGADIARVDDVAGTLRVIAADEARHADLAWSSVAWMLGSEVGTVSAVDAAAVASAFADAVSTSDESSNATQAATDVDAPTRLQQAMRVEGILTASDRAAVRNHVLRNLIAPALRAVLANKPAAVAERVAALPIAGFRAL